MSQARNPSSVADFVCRTHNHEIVRFEGMTVLTAMPVDSDPDWTKFMPVSVIAKQYGKSCVVWERNFARKSYPYLVMVDGQMVIAYVMHGKLFEVDTLRALRDLAVGEKLPVDQAVAIKKATADVMGIKPKYEDIERAFIDGRQIAQPALVAEHAAAPAAVAETPAAVQPVLALRDIPPATTAAPVKEPAPALSAAALSHKAELEAAHRAKIAARDSVIVYHKQTGAPLAGIPVKENEFVFCADGTEYVTLNADGNPVDHFKMKFSGNGKFHRKATVLVSAHIPASVLSDFSRDSSSLQH